MFSQSVLTDIMANAALQTSLPEKQTSLSSTKPNEPITLHNQDSLIAQNMSRFKDIFSLH